MILFENHYFTKFEILLFDLESSKDSLLGLYQYFCLATTVITYLCICIFVMIVHYISFHSSTIYFMYLKLYMIRTNFLVSAEITDFFVRVLLCILRSHLTLHQLFRDFIVETYIPTTNFLC